MGNDVRGFGRFCCGVKTEASAAPETDLLFSLDEGIPIGKRSSVRAVRKQAKPFFFFFREQLAGVTFSSSSFSSFIIPPQTRGSRAHRKLIPLSVSLFLLAEHLHIKCNTPAIFGSTLLK